MLYFTGIVISFFLALLLLTKKHKTPADKVLFAWLVVMGIHLGFFFLGVTGRAMDYPWVLGWDLPLPLVHGPFLYLYAATLTNRLPRRRWLVLLHFLPVLASYVYISDFFLLTDDQKRLVYENRGAGYETFMVLRFPLIIMSGIGYIIWTNVLLAQHRKSILEQFSNTEKINLQWLQYLSIGIAVIWAFVTFGTSEMTFTSVVAFVIFIGYFGIRQAGIFHSGILGPATTGPGQAAGGTHTFIESGHGPAIPVEQSVKPPTAPDGGASLPELSGYTDNTVFELAPRRKYSKSGLSEDMASRIHRELGILMETEKLYTESELSLADLATKLSVHPNYLSQVINEKEGRNFYDYINTLRIEAFKKLVTKPGSQKYTILSLAYECGFNSKSSFNRFFKKITGQSPSEYIDSLALSEAV